MANRDHASAVLSQVFDALIQQAPTEAHQLIQREYPFHEFVPEKRVYSEGTKLRIFLRDGFIDRYTGQRLVYIGALRLLSFVMPQAFPYHKNGKLDQCHIAYWELMPTLDHVQAISRGGADRPENWVTCSMLTNARKGNWTLDELQWSLKPVGDFTEWDGLIHPFLHLMEAQPDFLAQPFLRRYYTLAKNILQP